MRRFCIVTTKSLKVPAWLVFGTNMVFHVRSLVTNVILIMSWCASTTQAPNTYQAICNVIRVVTKYCQYLIWHNLNFRTFLRRSARVTTTWQARPGSEHGIPIISCTYQCLTGCRYWSFVSGSIIPNQWSMTNQWSTLCLLVNCPCQYYIIFMTTVQMAAKWIQIQFWLWI